MRAKEGQVYYAADYRENVLVLKIEKRRRRAEDDRLLIGRVNGETTSNYPGYLLGPAIKTAADHAR